MYFIWLLLKCNWLKFKHFTFLSILFFQIYYICDWFLCLMKSTNCVPKNCTACSSCTVFILLFYGECLITGISAECCQMPSDLRHMIIWSLWMKILCPLWWHCSVETVVTFSPSICWRTHSWKFPPQLEPSMPVNHCRWYRCAGKTQTANAKRVCYQLFSATATTAGLEDIFKLWTCALKIKK